MATFIGLVAIISWGILAVLGVYASSVPPFQLLFICFSVSAFLLFIKRLIKREPLFKLPTLTLTQWVVATCGLFGFHFCYFLALRYAPPIEASLIAYLWPLILGIVVANPHQRVFAVIGGILGFIGCGILVTGGESIQFNREYTLGYGLAFICALIWSSYSWFMAGTKSDVEDIGWISIAVAILALCSHLALETSHWDLAASAWTSSVLLGLGPVGGAFYLWDIGLKFGNRQLLASLSFATPVFSSIALFLFGISTLSTAIIMAIVLIMFGAVVSNALPALVIKRRQRHAARG
ncbi:EamA family transporter [Alteromonas sp. 1_MG-2023]|uniref:DMT family transporter n=1 Tax=Alteromonas sp. 1_MG-2023 TaxID=3062669 RepID=UPI0026E28BFB|nr:EamA family transporter [Alteromonas sp. 1_MG-2023]MDO6567803.1 EamA family transporter [Alteromonas sp. 1_MG-2023]